MDAVWVLAAIVIMLAALGLAVWLAKLARDMAGYVERARRAVARLDVIVADADGARAEAAHRADPHADDGANDPPVIERAKVQSQARVRDRCATDEPVPYPWDEDDDFRDET